MNYELTAAFHLEIFGNELAAQEGYEHHKGMDPVRFFLMNKYSWTPSQVKSMSNEDLEFAIAEDKHGWTAPKESRGAYPLPDVKIR